MFVQAVINGKITPIHDGMYIDHSSGMVRTKDHKIVGVVVRHGDQWQILWDLPNRKVITYEERWKDVPPSPPIAQILHEMKYNKKHK